MYKYGAINTFQVKASIIFSTLGMADIAQLECLANGATGIWAGLCEEGTAMGHASSCLTIINLMRLGNEKVFKWNCKNLRKAAREITVATTGFLPHPKQPVCGDRALDIVFSQNFLQKDSCKSAFLTLNHTLSG